MTKYKLEVRTDTVLLPNKSYEVGNPNEWLVAITLSVGLQEVAEGEEGRTWDDWRDQGQLFLNPWNWWPYNEAPKFRLYSVGDGLAVDLPDPKRPDDDETRRRYLHDLLNNKYREHAEAGVDRFVFDLSTDEDEEDDEDTKTIWAHGHEFLGRQPTPIPHFLNLAFVFVVANNVAQRGFADEGGIPVWKGLVAIPVVSHGDGRWGFGPQDGAFERNKDIATIGLDLYNPEGGKIATVGSFVAKIAPSIDEVASWRGGRLIDTYRLFSRRTPVAVSEGRAWRPDDWHVASEALLAGKSSTFACAAAIFSSWVAEKEAPPSIAEKTLLHHLLNTRANESLKHDCFPFTSTDEVNSQLLKWLIKICPLEPPFTLDQAKAAISEANIDIGAAIPGGKSAFPAFFAWREAVDPNGNTPFPDLPLNEAAADYLRLAEEFDAPENLLSLYVDFFSNLAGNEQVTGWATCLVRKLLDQEANREAELNELVKRDRLVAATHGTTKRSLLEIANQPDPSSVNSGPDEARRLLYLAAEALANTAIAPGVYESVLAPHIDAFAEGLASDYVESDGDRSDSNTGAGRPPSICIPIDQAGAIDTTEEDLSKFDLQALLNGGGLIVRANAQQQSWRIFNLADIRLCQGDAELTEDPEFPKLVCTPAPLAVSYETLQGRLLLRRPISIYDGTLPFPEAPTSGNFGGPSDQGKLLKLLGFELRATAPKLAKTPPLSARLDIQVVAFWIGPGGILPPALRDNGNPVKLKALTACNKIEGLVVEEPYLHSAQLRRRTRVGEPALSLPPAAITGAAHHAAEDGGEVSALLKKSFTIPPNVRPLWEDLIPALDNAEDRKLMERAPRILLWPNGDNWTSDPRSGAKVEFCLSPPRISLAEWRFWMLQVARDSSGADRELALTRINWANLIDKSLGAQIQILEDSPRDRIGSDGLLLSDPAVWQQFGAPQQGDGSIKGSFRAELVCRVRPFLATPSVSDEVRYDVNIGEPIEAGVYLSSEREFPVELSEGGVLEQRDEERAPDLRVEFKWAENGPWISFDARTNTVSIDLRPIAIGVADEKNCGLYLVDFRWRTDGSREDWFARGVSPNGYGAARSFLLEAVPEFKPDVLMPTGIEVWDAISVEKDPASRMILQATCRLPRPTGDFIDSFMMVGGVEHVWQAWTWDGAPVTESPFGKTTDFIRKESPSANTLAEPGPIWEALGFENRGLQGIALPERPLNATKIRTHCGPIPRGRLQAAEYYRVRSTMSWRYRGLLTRSQVGVTQASAREPLDEESSSYEISAGLSPWRGFAVKAVIDAPPAAPKVRWLLPLFHDLSLDSDAGGGAFILEEPAFSRTVGHNLAEGYQVEVMSYRPPGADTDALWPTIGDDPILSAESWHAGGADQLGSSVTLEVDALRSVVGQTLEPEAASSIVTGSVLTLRPTATVLGGAENKQVLFDPFTIARIRLRRQLDHHAVDGFTTESAILRGDWTDPYWIQFPANLTKLRLDDQAVPQTVAIAELSIRRNEFDRIFLVGPNDDGWKRLSKLPLRLRYFVCVSTEGVEAGGRKRFERMISFARLNLETGEIERISDKYADFSTAKALSARVILVQFTGAVSDDQIEERIKETNMLDLFELHSSDSGALPQARLHGMSDTIRAI